MKILRIIYDWPPPWQGLAPHPYELTKAQVGLGHKFVIFCGHWPKAGQREKVDSVEFSTFVREPLPGTLTLTSSVFLFFYYLWWRFDKNHSVDLIHAHGHFAIWIYLYRFILQKIFPHSRELSTPLVVHFHNIAAERERAAEEKNMEVKSYSKWLSWPMEKFANMLAAKTASACIFVSDENKKNAVDLYKADPNRCFVVESGVNPELFKPVGAEEKEKSRNELSLDRLDRVIVNHGVMVERKNIHILIEAMKYLPNIYKLLLVGPGERDYLEKLNKMIDDLQLKDRIIRAGYTPYPQTPIAFQVSDLFVLPSSWEGFPKVVIQSLSCGTPALVSGFKAQEEITGLFYLESLEPEQIANQIRQIVENPVNVNRFFIESKYSWKRKALQVEEIYTKLVKLY